MAIPAPQPFVFLKSLGGQIPEVLAILEKDAKKLIPEADWEALKTSQNPNGRYPDPLPEDPPLVRLFKVLSNLLQDIDILYPNVILPLAEMQLDEADQILAIAQKGTTGQTWDAIKATAALIAEEKSATGEILSNILLNMPFEVWVHLKKDLEKLQSETAQFPDLLPEVAQWATELAQMADQDSKSQEIATAPPFKQMQPMFEQILKINLKLDQFEKNIAKKIEKLNKKEEGDEIKAVKELSNLIHQAQASITMTVQILNRQISLRKSPMTRSVHDATILLGETIRIIQLIGKLRLSGSSTDENRQLVLQFLEMAEPLILQAVASLASIENRLGIQQKEIGQRLGSLVESYKNCLVEAHGKGDNLDDANAIKRSFDFKMEITRLDAMAADLQLSQKTLETKKQSRAAGGKGPGEDLRTAEKQVERLQQNLATAQAQWVNEFNIQDEEDRRLKENPFILNHFLGGALEKAKKTRDENQKILQKTKDRIKTLTHQIEDPQGKFLESGEEKREREIKLIQNKILRSELIELSLQIQSKLDDGADHLSRLTLKLEEERRVEKERNDDSEEKNATPKSNQDAQEILRKKINDLISNLNFIKKEYLNEAQKKSCEEHGFQIAQGDLLMTKIIKIAEELLHEIESGIPDGDQPEDRVKILLKIRALYEKRNQVESLWQEFQAARQDLPVFLRNALSMDQLNDIYEQYVKPLAINARNSDWISQAGQALESFFIIPSEANNGSNPISPQEKLQENLKNASEKMSKLLEHDLTKQEDQRRFSKKQHALMNTLIEMNKTVLELLKSGIIPNDYLNMVQLEPALFEAGFLDQDGNINLIDCLSTLRQYKSLFSSLSIHLDVEKIPDQMKTIQHFMALNEKLQGIRFGQRIAIGQWGEAIQEALISSYNHLYFFSIRFGMDPKKTTQHFKKSIEKEGVQEALADMGVDIRDINWSGETIRFLEKKHLEYKEDDANNPAFLSAIKEGIHNEESEQEEKKRFAECIKNRIITWMKDADKDPSIVQARIQDWGSTTPPYPNAFEELCSNLYSEENNISFQKEKLTHHSKIILLNLMLQIADPPSFNLLPDHDHQKEKNNDFFQRIPPQSKWGPLSMWCLTLLSGFSWLKEPNHVSEGKAYTFILKFLEKNLKNPLQKIFIQKDVHDLSLSILKEKDKFADEKTESFYPLLNTRTALIQSDDKTTVFKNDTKQKNLKI